MLDPRKMRKVDTHVIFFCKCPQKLYIETAMAQTLHDTVFTLKRIVHNMPQLPPSWRGADLL